MKSETELPLDSNFYESLKKFQQCMWCARAVAFLTARSHVEDRFGVAQLSRSNAAVVSTLISCLLSVEAYMGKKTNLQPPNQLMGSAGIKWATPYTGRRDVVVVAKKRSGPLYSEAFALADVLRTSIYCIISVSMMKWSLVTKQVFLRRIGSLAASRFLGHVICFCRNYAISWTFELARHNTWRL